ncbi:MAG: MBL fold metallo-hydrolase [Halioglobus sp.]
MPASSIRGDARPVLDALQAMHLELTDILVTHHHFDHVGGLQGLRERYQPCVYGPHTRDPWESTGACRRRPHSSAGDGF